MTTTITAAITAAASNSAASFGLMTVLLLIALLIKRELVNDLKDVRARLFSEALWIAIVPLFMVCALVFLFRISDTW